MQLKAAVGACSRRREWWIGLYSVSGNWYWRDGTATFGAGRLEGRRRRGAARFAYPANGPIADATRRCIHYMR
jgi:hypothetical protein